MEKIQKDTNVQSKIKLQQSKLQRLENQVLDLQRQLGSVDAVQAATLRKDRNVVFKKIDSLQAKKLAIMEKIESASKNVLALIERGMTDDEVRSLIGKPRAIDYSWGRWNYGKYWIRFDNSLVTCIQKGSCVLCDDECGIKLSEGNMLKFSKLFVAYFFILTAQAQA